MIRLINIDAASKHVWTGKLEERTEVLQSTCRTFMALIHNSQHVQYRIHTYIYIYLFIYRYCITPATIHVWFSLPLSICSGSLSQCWTPLGLVVGRSNSAAGPLLARPREKIVPPYALEALRIDEDLVIVIWFLAYECCPFFCAHCGGLGSLTRSAWENAAYY